MIGALSVIGGSSGCDALVLWVADRERTRGILRDFVDAKPRVTAPLRHSSWLMRPISLRKAFGIFDLTFLQPR